MDIQGTLDGAVSNYTRPTSECVLHWLLFANDNQKLRQNIKVKSKHMANSMHFDEFYKMNRLNA